MEAGEYPKMESDAQDANHTDGTHEQYHEDWPADEYPNMEADTQHANYTDGTHAVNDTSVLEGYGTASEGPADENIGLNYQKKQNESHGDHSNGSTNSTSETLKSEDIQKVLDEKSEKIQKALDKNFEEEFLPHSDWQAELDDRIAKAKAELENVDDYVDQGQIGSDDIWSEGHPPMVEDGEIDCSTTACPAGYECVTKGNTFVCIRIPIYKSCDFQYCPSGEHCVYIDRMFSRDTKCERKPDGCELIECGDGLTCQILNLSGPRCVRQLNIVTVCDNVVCGEKERCLLRNGVTECVAAGEDLCQFANCPEFYQCKIDEEIKRPFCKQAGASCADHPCNEDEVCHMIDGRARCSLIPEKFNVRCGAAGMIAESCRACLEYEGPYIPSESAFDDGELKCDSLDCEYDLPSNSCKDSVAANLCDKRNCPSGKFCHIDDDGPEPIVLCRPNIIKCDGMICTDGMSATIGTNNSGNAVECTCQYQGCDNIEHKRCTNGLCIPRDEDCRAECPATERRCPDGLCYAKERDCPFHCVDLNCAAGQICKIDNLTGVHICVYDPDLTIELEAHGGIDVSQYECSVDKCIHPRICVPGGYCVQKTCATQALIVGKGKVCCADEECMETPIGPLCVKVPGCKEGVLQCPTFTKCIKHEDEEAQCVGIHGMVVEVLKNPINDCLFWILDKARNGLWLSLWNELVIMICSIFKIFEKKNR